MTAIIDVPVTTRRLKDADPIKAIGPMSFGADSTSANVLKKQRNISGAAAPRARRVTFATLGFQIGT